MVKFLLQNNGLSLQVFCIEKNLSVVMILSSVGPCKSAKTIAKTIRETLQLLRKLNVLHIKLQVGLALPGVVFQMVADAERLAAMDAVEEIALLEGDTRERSNSLFFITLQPLAICSLVQLRV